MQVASREPFGATHTASAIDQGTRELRGLRDALSLGDDARRNVAVVITEGTPTLPYGASFPKDNRQAAVRALRRAGRANVRVFILHIATDESDLDSLSRYAKESGGQLWVAHDPEELSTAVSSLIESLSN